MSSLQPISNIGPSQDRDVQRWQGASEESAEHVETREQAPPRATQPALVDRGPGGGSVWRWAPVRIRDWFTHLRGGSVAYDLTPYRRALNAVVERERSLQNATDHDLREASGQLIARARNSGPAGPVPGRRSHAAFDRDVIESLAIARKASERVLGMRPHDVQIIAALAMHRGHIAEMQTGEGKTLAAALAGYVVGMAGRGVHMLTCNDYLARRDAEWMGPLYRFLGLGVAAIQEHMDPTERRDAYRCDITYATAKEVGFDVLRDDLCFAADGQVHRPFGAALVDEADSILIDEARIPLVIAGTVTTADHSVHRMAEVVARLAPERDFEIVDCGRNVHLTDSGVERVEAMLGCGQLHGAPNLAVVNQIYLALHARAVLRRDVDYVIRDGEIALVDELTGRIAEDRYWPAGLQAALEAKEGVRLKPEGRVLGQMTVQQLLQRYPVLCGMTATARPAATELVETYGLKVVVIPPNRRCIRSDREDRVYRDKAAKERALVGEIGRVHATGRPVLIGTRSVEESERLAAALAAEGLECSVLNARVDGEREAAIIAEAGDIGAITVSTNMAGRGTDIRLGGRSEVNREQVAALGGLYVIGTNRHESRRVDDQLRGRAGRQGDPGSSRFFISLEDDLLANHGLADSIPARWRSSASEPAPGDDGDATVDAPLIAQRIGHTQRVVEGQHAAIRHTLAKYCDILDGQGRVLHNWRREVLHGAASSVLRQHAPERWAAAAAALGTDELDNLERRITLFHIDRLWSEHLELAAYVREGVHLLSAAGKNPLDQYRRDLVAAFPPPRQRIEDAVCAVFDELELTSTGLTAVAEKLRGPSATWTYLVNDDPYLNGIEAQLGRNAGYAAGVAFYFGPLLFVWALVRKLCRGRKSS